MYRELLAHFPFVGLALAGQLLFFAIFLGALVWVFRKDGRKHYDRLANLPLEDIRRTHEQR